MRIFKSRLTRIAIFAVLALAIGRTSAQAPAEEGRGRSGIDRHRNWFLRRLEVERPGVLPQSHAGERRLLGEDGTLSRDQQLESMTASAKACAVEGYRLSDFGVLPLATGAYLLTYKAEQFVSCGGSKLPVHMNGSSVYIRKDGRWQAVYRAEVALKNQV